jgi:hypothetical protein
VSVFAQVIIAPTSTVTGFGMKQSGSQPGVDDPGAFSIVTS